MIPNNNNNPPATYNINLNRFQGVKHKRIL